MSFRSGDSDPSRQAEAPLALTPTSPSPIATNATDTTLRLRGRQDGKYEVVPNTRESKIAPYLDSWRSKVERLGTMNFPQIARQRGAVTGNPVLEVVIGADGKLKTSIVRRSSGRKDLDQAAQSILRLASPEHMRGRIAAVKSVFVGSSNELGAFESGIAATLLGASAAVWSGGLLTLGIVAVTAWRAPRLRRLDLVALAKAAPAAE